MAKPGLQEPIQSAIAVFGEFCVEAKRLWKALKKAIPIAMKDVNDNLVILKVCKFMKAKEPY